jgi:hypothetical protein
VRSILASITCVQVLAKDDLSGKGDEGGPGNNDEKQ